MPRKHITISLLVFLSLSLLTFPTAASAGGLISTSMEIEIGKSVRDEILAEYDLWDDPYDNELVQSLAQAVLPFADQRDLEYEFYVLESDDVNAFAAPGGFIFVTNGLLDFADRDPGLIAGVLAHEIGHVARKHHREAMEDALWQSIGLAILFHALEIDEEWIEIAAGVALLMVQQGYSRENEYDADRHGVRTAYRAGFDPDEGLIEFLRMIEAEYGSDNELGDIGRSIASHPDTDRRVFFAEIYLDEFSLTEEFNPQPYPEIEAKPPPDEEDELKKVDEPEWHVIYEADPE